MSDRPAPDLALRSVVVGGLVGLAPGMTDNRSDAIKELDVFDRPVPNRISAISHRRILREIIWIFDALLVLVVALVSTTVYHWFVYGIYGNLLQGTVLGAMAGLLFAILGAGRGLYKPGGIFEFLDQCQIILRVWAYVALFFLGVIFLTKSHDEVSRGTALIFLLVTPLTLFASRFFAARTAHSLTRTGRPLNLRVALIGPRSQTDAFLDYNRSAKIGLSVVGIFDPENRAGALDDMAPPPVDPDITRGSLDDLQTFALQERIDQIVVAMPWNQPHEIEALVDEIGSIPVPISLSPDPSASRFAGYPIQVLGGIPYFDIRPRRIDGLQGGLKIAMDRAASLVLLILLMPFLVLIGLAVKLDSRGPVLFRQRRNGFNNDVFQILKFRTMTTVDDGEVIRQAKKDDQRITRVGRFLRRTSLDELPQLINVLKGDMSLVGPRPHALAHNREYVKVISRYARRHNVKPGITGWAQVNGYRGETNTFEKLDGRLAHDLWYIEHWSLWLDIKILFMTVGKIFGQKNAY